ncbi:MAG: hypothetical protein HDS75_07940 [Bacteroidales bacterium]|nr:hypothetical protein [Bacteroidales bacterium]
MKKFIILSLAVAAGCAALHAERPKVVAHRGYWNTEGSAQNSIRSLVKADSIGADFAEFDVWLASDDVLVVNHDSEIGGYTIVNTPSTVLQENVRLANGEVIPTAEQYLDKAKELNVGLVYEIKWIGDEQRQRLCVQKSVEMVKAKGLADRTIYITFSPVAHDELGKQGVPHYYLTGASPEKLVEMGSDGPDFQFEVFYKNTDFIPEFKRLGMPINVWTPSTADHFTYFIDQDVDFITTDNPELLQKMLAETPSSVDVRVMDYNLDGAQTLDAIAANIAAEHPDFVTIQGVKSSQDLTVMAAKAGMYLYYTPAGDNNGVAVLSRRPAVETKSYVLPNQFRNTPCAAMVATFDLGHAIKVNIASADLTKENDVTRNHQAEFITRHLRDAGIPCILGTSLNDYPQSDSWKTMRGRFAEISGDQKTFPAPVPDAKMDYILSYPADKVTAKKSYVRPTAASYHMPTVADVTIAY